MPQGPKLQLAKIKRAGTEGPAGIIRDAGQPARSPEEGRPRRVPGLVEDLVLFEHEEGALRPPSAASGHRPHSEGRAGSALVPPYGSLGWPRTHTLPGERSRPESTRDSARDGSASGAASVHVGQANQPASERPGAAFSSSTGGSTSSPTCRGIAAAEKAHETGRRPRVPWLTNADIFENSAASMPEEVEFRQIGKGASGSPIRPSKA